MSGSNTFDSIGVYGTQGTPSASNIPGARSGGLSWTDISGNLWLFGGFGRDSTPSNIGFPGFLNDLWQFNPVAKTWTWISGSNTVNSLGVYGTQGVASASNVPRSRSGGVSWIDSTGNLWLFGGTTPDPNVQGDKLLNDLWKFSPASGTWTWVSGSNTINAQGVYGTKGVAAASNVPGARIAPISWIDANGNFWLFGGVALIHVCCLVLLMIYGNTVRQRIYGHGSAEAAPPNRSEFMGPRVSRRQATFRGSQQCDRVE